jgi:hypothetical protein
MSDPGSFDGYMVTRQVCDVVVRICDGLSSESADRAWTLIGPYGGGKSAFALFLATFLKAPECPESRAVRALKLADPLVYERAIGSLRGKRFLPVVATARREAIERSLSRAMQSALALLPQTDEALSLHTQIGEDLLQPNLGGHVVLDRLETLKALSLGSEGFGGMTVIIDELGRNLEYSAWNSMGDIHVLQELAEIACRSGTRPVVFLGVLHQPFEQYAATLGAAARTEWAKVQGRFTGAPFLEPAMDQMTLATRALEGLSGGDRSSLDGTVANIARQLSDRGCRPAGVDAEAFVRLCERAYPLHPTVLLTLPYVFRRVAQNERSLFAYLVGSEPFGVRAIADQGDERLVRLSDLYDYFAANLGAAYSRQPFARRWLEVEDALDRAAGASRVEIQILKTVGILAVAGSIPYVTPGSDLISLALADSVHSREVRAALELLRRRSLVVYRRYEGTYRIWEGSDLDLDGRLLEGRERTTGKGILSILNDYLPARPIVARRHSLQTGALRSFEITYLEECNPATAPPEASRGDAVIACVLPASVPSLDAAVRWASSDTVASRSNLVVVIPRHTSALRDTVVELAAGEWVWQNTPELRDDRVARRELADRTSILEARLAESCERLLDPRPEPVGSSSEWFHAGTRQQVETPAGVGRLLSDVMDSVFSRSPRVRNELVNRRSLSSAAAKARRNLIERMLTDSSSPGLRIDGYPPERAIYESALLEPQLHVEVSPGSWAFASPPDDDPCGLLPAWKVMDEAILGTDTSPRPLAEILKELCAAPYGVMPGLAPLLLAAFFAANRDYITLYRDGVFIPEPGIADFEMLMRRPDKFQIAGSRVQGERALVVERLARALTADSTVVAVARALFSMVRSLPDRAWRTNRVPPEVAAVRNVLRLAQSPERLLFTELPLAVGEQPFAAEPGMAGQHRIALFFDKLNACLQAWAGVVPDTIADAQHVLLSAFGLPPTREGWATLREEARSAQSLPLGLGGLFERLAADGTDESVAESVASFVSGRSPRNWSDAEVDSWPSKVSETASLYRDAVARGALLDIEEERQARTLALEIRGRLPSAKSTRVLRAALLHLLSEIN